MLPHRVVVLAGLIVVSGFGCGPRAAQPAPTGGEAPGWCWSLQRTFRDSLHLPPDTAVVPPFLELAVSATGVVTVPGTSMRGRWETLGPDSVRVEWGQGRQRTWLFGTVRDGRITASGHVFGTGGASALVTYGGTRVTCVLRDGVSNRKERRE